MGFNVTPYNTEDLYIAFQWQRGFDIFNTVPDGFPQQVDTGLLFGGQPSGQFITLNTPVSTNLGDIDWYGGIVMGKIKNVGPGNLNLFASGAISVTHPNDNLFSLPFGFADLNGNGRADPGEVFNAGFGLLYNQGEEKDSKDGYLVYLGARYDILSTKTKIGLEFNYGSKNWTSFVPAADDLWTAKLGTRGYVWEIYLIQELFNIPISKRGKAFFRAGYQYYQFDYTGSGNWVGSPVKIDDLSKTDVSKTQLLAPLKKAQDLYFTFDVYF